MSGGFRLADACAALPPPASGRAVRGPPGSGFVQRFSRTGSKLRIEMEEDAEAEARSLASLAVEQPALFRAVTGADNGKLPDLRGLFFGTDSLVGEGSNRVSDQVAQLSTVDRLDGPYTLDRRGPRMSSLTAQLSRCVVATFPFPAPHCGFVLFVGHRMRLLCREALPGLSQHGP